jgi:hypothetical protein
VLQAELPLHPCVSGKQVCESQSPKITKTFLLQAKLHGVNFKFILVALNAVPSGMSSNGGIY